MPNDLPLGCTDRQASGYHTHQHVDEELSETEKDATYIVNTAENLMRYLFREHSKLPGFHAIRTELCLIRNHANDIREREEKKR